MNAQFPTQRISRVAPFVRPMALLALATVLNLTLPRASLAQENTGTVHQELVGGRLSAQSAPRSRKTYSPASVRLIPDLRCTLHPPGTPSSSGLTIYTDDDGYARFHAVRATTDDAVKLLVLDCVDPAGKTSTHSVDLTSAETFAPHPLNLADQQGVDRPALRGDPLSYSSSELLEEGYGLRPDPDKEPAAYARWLQSASRPGRLLAAKRPSRVSHTVTTTSSPWWVGSVLTGAPNYISTEAIFNVPIGIPGGEGTTTTGIAIWNGLGGFNTGSGLIQGGIDVQTTPNAASYLSWREYCCGDSPASVHSGGAFVPNPGDQIYSVAWYCDSRGGLNINGGYGCTYLHDLTTGAIMNCSSPTGSPCSSVPALPLCSVSPKTPNCMTLGLQAEFIIEDQSPQLLATSKAFTDFTPIVTMSGSAYSSTTNLYSQTISTDPAIFLLTDFTNDTTHISVSLGQADQTYFGMSPGYGPGGLVLSYSGTPCTGQSCPGWRQLDNNPATVDITADGTDLYQLHNTGRIWVSTGARCSDESCPGWRMLDENTATVQIAADSPRLYQLHNTGEIFEYTGAPCNGDTCAGWQMLDNNPAAVSITAGGGQLYQLHNDGSIWRYTGRPCSGSSCPGWQMLDNNPAATAIAAANGLYQLHNDGSIWRYTGTPCNASGCPGWQMLDNNSATTAIAAANGLYQLHNDGSIWRYTGTPCNVRGCPGWQALDKNPKAVAIASAGGELYEMHHDGEVWHYVGTPCSGNSCPGWEMVDDNPTTGMISAGGNLYQLYADPIYELDTNGSLWRYTGSGCGGTFCPTWAMVDNNPGTVAMAAGDGQFYQLHRDGSIWRHDGTPCSGSSCPGWIELDNNPRAKAIAAGGSQLYQLHTDGSIWRHNGTPCSGSSCPGWIELDNNPGAKAIAAGGSQLYQLHTDGSIWRHNGTPCSGSSCPGWIELDNNPAAVAIAAASKELYQLHRDGSIWRHTGVPCGAAGCPGWQQLDNNPAAKAIAANGNELVQLHKDGSIWVHTGTPCSGGSCPGWLMVDNNPAAVSIATDGSHIYQRHSDGSIWLYTGPACSGTNCPGWVRMDVNAAAQAIIAGGFH